MFQNMVINKSATKLQICNNWVLCFKKSKLHFSTQPFLDVPLCHFKQQFIHRCLSSTINSV